MNQTVWQDIECRLVENDEVREVREYITCVICCQVINQERNPVECDKCCNQLFCKVCIDTWKRQNNICPCCR